MIPNSAILDLATQRPPDFTVGPPEAPYLRRWWVVPRNPGVNTYLHQFLASDDDRALHDHRSWNISVLLRGRYIEHTPYSSWRPEDGCPVKTITITRREGESIQREAWQPHRIQLLPGEEAWSLFITGPHERNWGFWCPQGWVPWEQFTAAGEGRPGEVGPGCG